MQYPETLTSTARYIQEKSEEIHPSAIGVILGSGLGGSPAGFDLKTSLEYEEIPGFPDTSIPGHAGRLDIGEIGKRQALLLRGRFHIYEGYTAKQACVTVRALGALGVKTLILTNAAGALNQAFEVGSLMLINDHINFTGQSPLTGRGESPFGPRFTDMSRAWSPELAALATRQAEKLAIGLERGVYVQVAGPQYETPAETRMLGMLGADAVGMSTAIEAIAAAQLGMSTLGISCLTNKNVPEAMESTSHAKVTRQAEHSAGNLMRLIGAVASAMR